MQRFAPFRPPAELSARSRTAVIRANGPWGDSSALAFAYSLRRSVSVFARLSGSSPIPLTSHTVASTSQAGASPSTGITRLRQYYGPLRLPARPSPCRDVRVAIPTNRISPVARKPFSGMLLPLPRWTRRVHLSILPRPLEPSPR
jgi:hypothetical protein